MKNSHSEITGFHAGPRLKQSIKSTLLFCFYYSGLEWLLARLIRVQGAAVLMYHGVSDGAPIPAHINFHVEREIFERQMRILKRRYRVIPLRDLVAALMRGEPLEKAVVLTFDDGYRNNASHAAPVLERLGLPYTVFVATSYVDTGRWMPLNQIYWMWASGELSTEEMNEIRGRVRGRPLAESVSLLEAAFQKRRAAVTSAAEDSFGMLNWDQIQGMAAAGADFGSHTHSHCNLAAENPSQQATELRVSKEALERHLQRPVRLFAYPYGRAEHMSEASRGSVMETGYECAISAQYGLVTSRSDRFCLPRLGYASRMWAFAGDICYQFVKQAVKDALPGRRATRKTKGLHG